MVLRGFILATIFLIVYGFYDIRRDLLAWISVLKYKTHISGSPSGVTVEDVFHVLQKCAPRIGEQPFSWTVLEGSVVDWFDKYGDVKAMSLRENKYSVDIQIQRANTLVDSVRINKIPNANVSLIEMSRSWHGRYLPKFMTKKIRVDSTEAKSFESLYGKGLDADLSAVFNLYQYYLDYASALPDEEE